MTSGPRPTHMHHRIARAARLFVVAALLGVVGASVGSSPAAACSCNDFTTRQVVGEALAIVSGEPVDRWDESIDDRNYNVWAFEVDERWIGDTPAVIEVQAADEENSCGPPAEVVASILRLGWRASNGRYDVSTGCAGHTLSGEVVDRLFGPPELVVEGEPVAVVSADAGGHAAKLVDAGGRALGYLPGDGETHGLAPCPGGEYFAQLRGEPGDEYGMARSFEVALWRYDGWVEIGTVAVESPEPIETAETLVCSKPDGSDVLVVWSTYYDATRVVHGVAAVEPLSAERPIDVAGPDGASFRFRRDQFPRVVDSAGAFDVVWDLGDGWTRSISGRALMSVIPVDDGWDLTVGDRREVSPDTSQSGFRVIRARRDGRATASSEFVPIESLGWASGLSIPPERRVLTGLEPSVPLPLFERTGTAVNAPPAPRTEPASDITDDDIAEPTETTAAAGVEADGAQIVDTDVAGGDDAASWPQWAAGGMLVLVLGGVVLTVQRRGKR